MDNKSANEFVRQRTNRSDDDVVLPEARSATATCAQQSIFAKLAFARRGSDNRDTLLYFAADFAGLANEADVAEQTQRRERRPC